MANDRFSLPYCLSTIQISCTKQVTQFTQNENRRSANYQTNQWTHELVQSLGNHLVETLQERAKKLEENVQLMINGMDMDSLNLLELVDDINRLGLSNLLHEDINKAIDRIVSIEYLKDQTEKSLHETALLFRILTQHGFHVSQGANMFKSFKDEEKEFKAEISNGVHGMLSVYEASYLTFEGESLCEANTSSRTHLINLMKEGMKAKVTEQVRHALEGLPCHQSFHILEAQQYIDTYDKTKSHNLLLLKLATLYFNLVQSSHKKELKETSRWWRDFNLTSKLNFTRDILVETFFWLLRIFSESRFANYHRKTH
ncbi:Isoprene synthase, chloroplastic, partial [Mucuna pruriens]